MSDRKAALQMGLLAHETAKNFNADRYFGRVLAEARARAGRRTLDI